MFRHMNIERFNEIEKEVVMLVESTIIAVKEKSFEDYVLLLIHADFYEFIDSHRSCGLFPYVIEDPSDEYMDITRQKFLAQYLNNLSGYFNNKGFMCGDCKLNCVKTTIKEV